MARMRRKADLPTKTCPACARPFAWRKKWERVWDEVRFCSDRCRTGSKAKSPPVPAEPARAMPAGCDRARERDRRGDPWRPLAVVGGDGGGGA